MLSTWIVLSLITLSIFPSQKQFLVQDYNFLVMDGGVNKFRQIGDTLYDMDCSLDLPCQPRLGKHYKILDFQEQGIYSILKLERLDSIPLTIDPIPETRFSVVALKNINERQLGYLPYRIGLTRSQLDTVQVNELALEGKFFYTYFSDEYLKEMSGLEIIDTVEEANTLLEVLKSDVFKPLMESYKNTKTYDMYGSGFTAEIFNQACISKGFNPIGAGRAVNGLLKNSR